MSGASRGWRGVPHPSGRARLVLITLAYFSTVGVIGVVSGIIGPTLEGLASQVGVTLSVIGLVVTMRSVGYLLGAVWAGGWADGDRSHALTGFSLALSSACLAAAPLAPSLWLLLLIMVLLGCALGALDVAGNALVLHHYRDRSGPYLNALHFFFGIGGLLGPLVASIAASTSGGIAWAYWIVAVFPVPFAGVLLLSHRPSGSIRQLTTENRQAPLRLAFILAASLYLFYVGGQIALVSWLFVYAEAQFTTRMATWIMGAFWGAFSLFRFLGIWISRHWMPERVLGADYVVVIVSAIPLLVWPASAFGLWVGAIGMGAAHASIYATSVVFLERRFIVAGKQMSAIVVLLCIGMMVFPWLMGQLYGPQRAWVIPGLATALIGCAAAVTVYTARNHPILGSPSAQKRTQSPDQLEP